MIKTLSVKNKITVSKQKITCLSADQDFVTNGHTTNYYNY